MTRATRTSSLLQSPLAMQVTCAQLWSDRNANGYSPFGHAIKPEVEH